MGFHVFNISQQVRRNFHQLLQQKFQSNVNFDWEYFDDETTRRDVSNCSDPEFQKFITMVMRLAGISNNKKNTFHYVKYNITDNYTIGKHHDSCENTIVIFLIKDPKISEETFIVEGETVNEDYWKKGGLLMTNESLHEIIINGTGKREVFCIFNSIN